MASVAMLRNVLLLFPLISQVIADAQVHPAVIPTLVNISDLWEKAGTVHEDKHIREVIVTHGLGRLHLICEIEPPLPLTEEHFRLRNDLVRFEKLYPEHHVILQKRFWSDDQKKTAVALDTGSIGLFGTYACTYGKLRKTVEVLAENIDVLKDLPAPKTLEELFSLTFIKKNLATNGEKMKIKQLVTGNKDFHCHCNKSAGKSASVHKLTPADIDVVATLGDSFMVGLGAGATSFWDYFKEYRGLSWSIGGDSSVESVLTLPNILKRFNPLLKGFSTKTGKHYEKNSGLNMATVSSTTRDLQSQVEDLVMKLRSDNDINVKENWKLVTIMIGSRDLCRICDKVILSPDDYIELLMNALDTLKAKLPRTFVNLVLPLNVSALESFYRHGDCLLQNWSICPCIRDEFMRQKISNFLLGYKFSNLIVIHYSEDGLSRRRNKLAHELVESGVYDRTDDFTVVIQPLFDYGPFGEQHRDLFSLDCFHLSAKGNALAAMSLWNSMLEPVDKKHTEWSEQSIKCPSKESPYFSTSRNSKVKKRRSREGASAGVIAAFATSALCALAFVLAFIFLRHRLQAPATTLSFNSTPWIKYSI